VQGIEEDEVANVNNEGEVDANQINENQDPAVS
jgi:hypothetical protein